MKSGLRELDQLVLGGSSRPESSTPLFDPYEAAHVRQVDAR